MRAVLFVWRGECGRERSLSEMVVVMVVAMAMMVLRMVGVMVVVMSFVTMRCDETWCDVA